MKMLSGFRRTMSPEPRGPVMQIPDTPISADEDWASFTIGSNAPVNFLPPQAQDAKRAQLKRSSTGSVACIFSVVHDLLEFHQNQVEAAKNGEAGDKTGRFRELLEKLAEEHERQVTATRAEVQRLKPIDEECAEDALWTIGDANVGKIASLHFGELAEEADQLQIKNDIIDKNTKKIKADRQLHENEMIKYLDELRRSEWKRTEDAQRKQIAEHLSAMESANVKLAALRYEQIENIERIRELKIQMWKLKQGEKVNKTMKDLERTMRLGENKWWLGSQSVALTALEEELKKEDGDVMAGYEATRGRFHELTAHLKDLEFQQCKLKTNVWEVQNQEQDVWIDRMRDNFELQVLVWRRSHISSKHLFLLEESWKVVIARKMFQRQADVEKVLRSRNPEALCRLYRQLHVLCVGIQEKTLVIKQQIQVSLERVNEVQRKLKAHLYNHEEASSLRDENLILLYTVKTDGNRLAWLRKEHLQTVELSGLIRWAASEANIEIPSPIVSL